MNKLLLLLPIMIFPLLAIAEEDIVKLDLTYKMPIDFNYCDNNPPECQPLPPLVPQFDMQPAATNKQWLIFWTFQLLDVYSTSKALKYDCIKEVNPLFTESPSNTRLILTKSVILMPGLLYNDYWKNVDPEELDNTNILYAAVVGNNFRLLNKAKRECNKIR